MQHVELFSWGNEAGFMIAKKHRPESCTQLYVATDVSVKQSAFCAQFGCLFGMDLKNERPFLFPYTASLNGF